MKTTPALSRHLAGMTLVEVLAVLVILLILAAMLLPQIRGPAHPKAKRIMCVNNLKEIGLSYKIWEGDNGDKFPFEVSVTNGGTMEVADQAWLTYQVMSNVLSTPKVLTCPADGGREQATNFITDSPGKYLSYFVGLDADDTHPLGILSGDDNLAVGGIRVRTGIFTANTNSPPLWTTDRHANCGNLGLGDGSVQQVTPAGLARAILTASIPTNQVRFVIP